MNKVFIPEGYRSPLNVYDMQIAIEFIKHNFQKELAHALNLRRVSAPLFVRESSGLNDNLNGYERPVSFDVPAVGAEGQVVHSLAKWKRFALKKYNFRVGKGIYTDMNAIRRDEQLDNLHSIYVDQWDWEKIIRPEDRTLDYLRRTAQEIVECVCDVSERLNREFSSIHVKLGRELTTITTQELEDMFPDIPVPGDRENAFLEKHGTVLLTQIGGKLKSGKPHDGRAPDYDDWALNGDILFWNPVLGRAFEISSMGVRVDPESMDRQLTLAGCDDRRSLPFHKMLLNGELPLTIGGGIGQSRLCMLMIGCAHIGEVQSSLWDEETLRACREAGIMLL
ncbi:MAG: aspartate--ammonia ligase, partial [Clostridia bacterium]|nr:aspartate--ammonia ligase [Clostridia bacterium]